MTKFLAKFARDESGATAIEYGLIASLIAVVMIAAASTLGQNISGVFTNIGGNIK